MEFSPVKTSPSLFELHPFLAVTHVPGEVTYLVLLHAEEFASLLLGVGHRAQNELYVFQLEGEGYKEHDNDSDEKYLLFIDPVPHNKY